VAALPVSAPARPWVLAETSWRTVADTQYELAVLPWGATEAHNYHLPYGTDSIETEAIAVEAGRLAWAAGARVVVLPTVPFGVQTGQLDIPLCLNMNPSTQLALLHDLTRALSGQGIRRLVIVNGHGGNDFRALIRELQPTAGLFLCLVDWYRVVDPRTVFEVPGDHAGEMETNLIQHLAPHLALPLSQAGPGAERRSRIDALREGWAWTPRHWRSVSADTGIGDPRAATPEKGARYFAAVTERLAAFLAQLASADPDALYESDAG
jgi:creatinine amidohydrolase